MFRVVLLTIMIFVIRHSVSGKGDVWHTHENVVHKAVKGDVFINTCPFGHVENPTCLGTSTQAVKTDHDHFKPNWHNNHDTAIFESDTSAAHQGPTPDPHARKHAKNHTRPPRQKPHSTPRKKPRQRKLSLHARHPHNVG